MTTKTKGSEEHASASDREIVIARLLDAPQDLVFEAWTNPKHVALWWGPNEFTNTVHEMDVRPGGVWRLTMHGPDGVDFPNKIVFIEVDKPRRLVYTHGDDTDDPAHQFHVTITFEKKGNKTNLTMRSIFATAAERNRVIEEFGAIEGGKQHLARLAEYLQTMAA
jgi:uncharacterized protein YndB with AHSA1/START domain